VELSESGWWLQSKKSKPTATCLCDRKLGYSKRTERPVTIWTVDCRLASDFLTVTAFTRRARHEPNNLLTRKLLAVAPSNAGFERTPSQLSIIGCESKAKGEEPASFLYQLSFRARCWSFQRVVFPINGFADQAVVYQRLALKDKACRGDFVPWSNRARQTFFSTS
jgi:hypothetical protein